MRFLVEGVRQMVKHLVQNEDGQTLVEYGLLVALIALVVIGILTVLGGKVRNIFVTANTGLKSTT